MRLIDADAYSAEMKDRQDAAWKWRNEAIAEEDELKLARAEGAYTAFTEAKLTMDKHIISPWHRVEEQPKEHGKYPVCWVENGNFYWQEAHYCYYQDGDKWVAWSSYQGDDVEITPDYWMQIEPPKEDA